ncbi:MAG: hypothetical protein OXE05_07045 [Chloroflexi bacterium]|nr:hypothetical protein [Chloroflexota bacterium]
MLLRVTVKKANERINAKDPKWTSTVNLERNEFGAPNAVKVSVTILGRTHEAMAQLMIDTFNPSLDSIQHAEDTAFAKAVNRFGFDFEVDPERSDPY